MRAVVLAAGRGSRLGADDLPKPLWPIGPRGPDDPTPISPLERQIACLRRAGVERIGVVIGWRREVAARRLAPLGVELIENTHPDISRSGTTHSVQYAACSSFAPLDGAEPLLVMDGDIVYEQKLMDVVADEDGSSAVVVSPHVRADCEEVRVYGDGRRPRLVGKGLGPPITGSLELLGEATGILRLARSEHDLARALLTWLVGKPDGDRRSFGFAGIGSEHEELAQYLMTLGRLEAVRLDPDLLFMEADFAEDFARLRDEVYPEILRKDSSLE